MSITLSGTALVAGGSTSADACAAREVPQQLHPIEVGLDKLAAMGSVGQVRDYLVELGVRGACCNPFKCVIAEYLIIEGYVAASACLAVCPSEDGGRVELEGCGQWPLPPVLNDLAMAFDCYQFPELELAS
jgi:hypothetical protein